MSSTRNPSSSSPYAPGAMPPERLDVSGVTAEGAAWLASAGTYPRSTLALWRERPDAPVVLLCGSAFDVVSTSALFGRRMLDRLWDEGPGSGPVAAHRGRILLFAAPGTAQRLPSVMEWEEWGPGTAQGHGSGAAGEGAAGLQGDVGNGGRGGRCREVPPLLCHGTGDAVTVPPVNPGAGGQEAVRPDSRWLVAPDTRLPWLPGPEILLWAAVRAARAAASAAVRISIFPRADQDAKVYDVSRRR
ncbi:bifunctional DNA primase/polymerase [Streptomyces sp. NPDC059618]|uniref:bifunctional DNA primase/polymerase n=1 Tax=Streptomyces sp. NPDC059618 TaxID=3346887 RepID=UPI00367CCD0F